MSPNKIIYKFKIKKTFLLLNHDNDHFIINDLSNKRLKYRVEIMNVTFFANVKIKIYYDLRHTLLLLNSNNKVYLRLNHNY